MAVNRMAMYEILVNTYREEVGKLDANLSGLGDEIRETKAKLVALELMERNMIAERAAQVEQLKGVRAVLFKMEDAAKAAARANEDAYLDGGA